MKRLFSRRFGPYLLGVGLLVLTTGLGELATKYASVDPHSVDMLYILSVAISAMYLGPGPSVILSFLSMLVFDLFFVLPLYSFAVSNQKDTVNLFILWLVCIVITVISPKNRT